MNTKKIASNYLIKTASTQEQMLKQLDNFKGSPMAHLQFSGPMKSHTVPAHLAGPIARELISREPSSKLEKITRCHDAHLDFGGAMMVGTPVIDLHAGNVTVKMLANQVSHLPSALSKSSERNVEGHPYYKVHGLYGCIVLTPEQFRDLEAAAKDPEVQREAEEAMAAMSRKNPAGAKMVDHLNSGGGVGPEGMVPKQEVQKEPIELTATEKSLVKTNQIIEAIRSVRSRIPGTGLKEAKDAVEAWKDAYEHANAGKPHALNEKEMDLVREGAPMQAVASLRDRGCPIHEAFRLVRQWKADNGY